MLFRSNDTATTEIYTLSLHDALPISIVIDPESFTFFRVPVSSAANAEVTANRLASRNSDKRRRNFMVISSPLSGVQDGEPDFPFPTRINSPDIPVSRP